MLYFQEQTEQQLKQILIMFDYVDYLLWAPWQTSNTRSKVISVAYFNKATENFSLAGYEGLTILGR